MESGLFFFWNSFVVNKTSPTINAIKKTPNAKKDKMTKVNIIQKTKLNLVLKGIF